MIDLVEYDPLTVGGRKAVNSLLFDYLCGDFIVGLGDFMICLIVLSYSYTVDLLICVVRLIYILWYW